MHPINDTIPSTALLSMDQQQKVTATIPRDTLFNLTSDKSRLYLTSLYDTTLYSFDEYAFGSNTIYFKFSDLSTSYKNNISLTFFIDGVIRDTLNLFNHFHNNNFSINHQRESVSITPTLKRLHFSVIESYTLLLLGLNCPHLFTAFDIDLPIATNTLHINMAKPIHRSRQVDIKVNSAPTINLIATRSEPIQMSPKNTTYALKPDFILNPDGLVILESQRFWQREPSTSHQKTFSIPIQCYQNQCPHPKKNSIFTSYNDDDNRQLRLQLGTTLKQALKPITTSDYIPSFNYYFPAQQNQLDLLTSFLSTLIRDKDSVFYELLERLIDVQINPIGNHLIEYHLIFDDNNIALIYFVHLLQQFLNGHRPLNLAVSVTYEIR